MSLRSYWACCLQRVMLHLEKWGPHRVRAHLTQTHHIQPQLQKRLCPHHRLSMMVMSMYCASQFTDAWLLRWCSIKMRDFQKMKAANFDPTKQEEDTMVASRMKIFHFYRTSLRLMTSSGKYRKWKTQVDIIISITDIWDTHIMLSYPRWFNYLA